MDLNIDIKSQGHAWANIQIDSTSCLIGIYVDGKIEQKLLMDREQAAQLAQILNAFANNQI